MHPGIIDTRGHVDTAPLRTLHVWSNPVRYSSPGFLRGRMCVLGSPPTSLSICSPPPPTPKITVLMYHLPSDQTLLLLIETPCVGRLQRVLLCPQERVHTPLRCPSHLRAHGGRTASQLGRQLVQTDLSSLAWEGFELRLPPGGQCLNQPGDSTAPEQRPIRPCEVSPSVAVVMHLLCPHRSSVYRELAQCARCWGRKAGRTNTDSHLCSPNVLGSSPSSATY